MVMAGTTTWDELEWKRDDMLIQADDLEVINGIEEQIEQLRQRELRRARELMRRFRRLLSQAEAGDAGPMVLHALRSGLRRAEIEVDRLASLEH